MASDDEIIAAFHLLEPYVAPAMVQHHVAPANTLLKTAGPYLALDWLLGSVCLPEVHVPREILENAINCMDTEDRENYQTLL